MDIAIFGSAFNPPHLGHLAAMTWLADRFDTVIAVPSFRHAFGKKMAPFLFRCEALRILLRAAPENIVVSDIESSFYGDEPIYSYDLLCRLSSLYPDARLSLALGSDNIESSVFSRFHRSKDILRDFSVVAIPDFQGFRSTLARAALSSSCGAPSDEAKRLLGEPLAFFCFASSFYSQA